MSDRCYAEVTCRQEDAGRFEEIGFKANDKGRIPGTVVLVDYEADYGHCDDLPKRDTLYFGWHSAGTNYPPQVFASDGKQYVEAETMNDGSLAVCVSDKGRLDKRMLNWAREYQACLKRTKEALRKRASPGRGKQEDG